jgi:hypothetical protein
MRPLAVGIVVALACTTAAPLAGASGHKGAASNYSQVVRDARAVAGAAAEISGYEDKVLYYSNSYPGVASNFITQFAAMSESVGGLGWSSDSDLSMQVARETHSWVYYTIGLAGSRQAGTASFACAKVSKHALSWAVISGKCR